jgi:hypothetical protein
MYQTDRKPENTRRSSAREDEEIVHFCSAVAGRYLHPGRHFLSTTSRCPWRPIPFGTIVIASPFFLCLGLLWHGLYRTALQKTIWLERGKWIG